MVHLKAEVWVKMSHNGTNPQRFHSGRESPRSCYHKKRIPSCFTVPGRINMGAAIRVELAHEYMTRHWRRGLKKKGFLFFFFMMLSTPTVL